MLRRDLPRAVPRLSWRGVGWLLLYAIGLGLSEFFVIGKWFGYLGFENSGPNWTLAIVFLVPYILCARRLPASWERPSAIVYWMLFVVVVASVHVMPIFLKDFGTSTWIMVGSIDVAFWLLGGLYSVRLAKIPRPPISPRLFWWSFAGIWLGLLVMVIAFYGVKSQLPSLEKIYTLREEYRTQLAQVPMIARYAVTWLGNVFAPIALARGLVTRRWLWAAAALLTELLLVSITGFKQLMFSWALVVVVVIFVRFTDVKKIGSRIAPIVASGLVLLTAFEWVRNTYSISSIVVRRLVLTAGLNTQYFFEFYTWHDQAHLGYGLFSKFVDYPYDLTPAFLIGSFYYGNWRTSANANIWADGYANFGVVGVLVFTAILAVVLYVADSVSARLPLGIGVAALAVLSFSLSNTALLTVLLTHGLLLVVAVLYFMPEEAEGDQRRGISSFRRRKVPEAAGEDQGGPS